MLECVTLIIGVGNYQHMGKVSVAGVEAKLVYEAVLEHLKPNLKPILRHDQFGSASADRFVVAKADWLSLVEAFRLFKKELNARRGKCVAFFYYSGHGLCFEQGHYLYGNDSEGTYEDGLCFEDNVLKPMRECAVAGLAVLNCCRNLGFKASESVEAGPTRDCGPATRQGGAYVCWAANHLEKAKVQSKFTTLLVQLLFRSDLSVLKATGLVFDEVEAAGQQRPVGNLYGCLDQALNTPLVRWRDLDQEDSSGPGAGSSTAAVTQKLAAQQLEEQLTPNAAQWLKLDSQKQYDIIISSTASLADIRGLVGLLQTDRDVTGQERAARVLRYLACNNTDNRVAIAKAGAIPPLVALLGSQGAGVQEQAAWALKNLAVYDDNEVAIAKAGAIPPLVALLGSQAAGVQKQAAAALANLAYNDDNRVAIAKAGAIPPLVALLGSQGAGVQEQAAWALKNLACNNTDNRIAIAKAGAIPPLVALLGSQGAGVQEQAAAALRNLAWNTDNKVAIANAGAIPPLVALLGSQAAGVQEQAAAALRNLASNDDNKVAIAKAGAIPPLVALLGSQGAGVQEQAAGALRDMACNDDNKVAVAKAGAIPPLVALLGSKAAGVQEQAAAALVNLASNAANKEAIKRTGAIPMLQELAKKGLENAQGALGFLE